MTTELVAEAVKKAGIAWIAVPGTRPLGLWVLPLDGALIVLSGPGEQQAPGLAEAGTAEIRLRGDSGGLIVIAEARVERLAPGTPEWAEVTPQLAAKRLNAKGSAEEQVARWAETGCAVVRLTPTESPAVSRPDLPTGSGAATPRETPARVPAPQPFRLHRVRGKRR